MQEPLSDKEIEELIAEFLEVESKVSIFLYYYLLLTLISTYHVFKHTYMEKYVFMFVILWVVSCPI